MSKKLFFKFLTFVFVLLTLMGQARAIISQQINKTHLRWNMQSPKDSLVIRREGTILKIQTLDINILNELSQSFAQISIPKEYIESVNISKEDFPKSPAEIKVTLKDKSVEVFSFYKEDNKNHVIDFWIQEKLVDQPKAVSEISKADLAIEKKIMAPKKPVIEPVKNVAPIVAPEKVELPYRDFRYGAAFIFDYQPVIPSVQELINIKRKTPEAIYPLTDREYNKDEKEAHMQLTINLYNKEKYGLMYKSIKLYEQKYGIDTNRETNEYIKALSILKNNINNTDEGPRRSALNILSSISAGTKNYELKQAIYKYSLQYYINLGDFVNVLQMAQSLYATSRENFDQETSIQAAEIIMHALAQMRQDEKLLEFSNEKLISKLISPQLILAYQIFVHVKNNNLDQAIKLYEKAKPGLKSPYEPTIIYNIAEAYFRKSQYENSLSLFDEFLKDFSFRSESSFARIRIALIYDLSKNNVSQSLELYQNAINRSSILEARYEAQIRYVGLELARKIKLSSQDSEKLAFLENPFKPDEKLDKNLEMLLWIVRLRTLINSGDFENALTYMNALPIMGMKPIEQNVFLGDGAEIIYGLIKKFFNEGKYAQVVDLWERYKDLYINKVAMDPYLNFTVAQAYLKLNLEESFNLSLKNFDLAKSGPERTFPIWIPRTGFVKTTDMVSELRLLQSIQQKNWDQASKLLNEFKQVATGDIKTKYYQGLIAYHQKNYVEATKDFEDYLYQMQSSMDTHEARELLYFYANSLYQVGNPEKFKNVTKALLKDTKENKTPKMKEVVTQVQYLYIETLAGEGSAESYLEIEKNAKEFLKSNQASSYKNRVKYLLGKSLAMNKKESEAKDLFQSLIDDKEVIDYIKDLSKTELTSLRLKEVSL